MSDTPFSTRRQFINRGLTIVGAGATVPAFLERTAWALTGPDDGPLTKSKPGVPDDRILVVIQLAGGNDGLNTVIPVEDDAYHRARPRIGIAKKDALRLTDAVGLSPAAMGLKSLYDEGLLSIVQAVGYPNPNRSHFQSTDIWMIGDPNESMHNGWLGRYFDCTCNGTPDPKTGIALTSEAPMAMMGSKYRPVAFATPDQLSWQPGDKQGGAEAAFKKLNDLDNGHNADGTLKPVSMLDYLQRTAMDARLSARQIQDAAGESSARRGRGRNSLDILRPGAGRGGLEPQLKMVARMIAAKLPTRVYYVSMGGFDTHANQQIAHQNLMRQLGAALSGFVKDLRASGDLDRVLAMTFSEFGRRVAENASGGTDHGTAAPMFLIGKPIAAGIQGEAPSLSDLDRGDLKHKIDFRKVYSAVLSGWLKADAKAILGGDFGGLKLVK